MAVCRGCVTFHNLAESRRDFGKRLCFGQYLEMLKK